MMRFSGYVALSMCCVALPSGALAQIAGKATGPSSAFPTPSATGTSGDTVGFYDANALRVESRGQGLRIFRGLNGPMIAQTGAFQSFDLAAIVAPSEKAMVEAREFNRHYGPGMFATVAGGVILGTAVLFDLNSDPNWAITTAEVGGAAVALYGGRRLNLSYSALSKSIWWYNRELKK